MTQSGYDFEGQAPGTTATTGNTGVFALTGTCQFDADHAVGSSCLQLVNDTSSANDITVRTPTTTDIFGLRFYQKLTGRPSAIHQWLRVDSASNTNINLSTTGFAILGAGGTNITATGSALPLNQWCRIEVRWQKSTGAITYTAYDSTETLLQSASTTGVSFGAGTLVQSVIGKDSPATVAPMFIDAVITDDASTGEIGPIATNTGTVSGSTPKVTGSVGASIPAVPAVLDGAGNSTQYGTGDTITDDNVCTIPTNTSVGDVLIAVMSAQTSGTAFTQPSGWTMLTNLVVNTREVGVAWYAVTDSAALSALGSTVDFVQPSTGSPRVNVTICRVLGADMTAPVQDFSVTSVTGTTTTVAFASRTDSAGIGAMVFGATTQFSSPANMTISWDNSLAAVTDSYTVNTTGTLSGLHLAWVDQTSTAIPAVNGTASKTAASTLAGFTFSIKAGLTTSGVTLGSISGTSPKTTATITGTVFNAGTFSATLPDSGSGSITGATGGMSADLIGQTPTITGSIAGTFIAVGGGIVGGTTPTTTGTITGAASNLGVLSSGVPKTVGATLADSLNPATIAASTPVVHPVALAGAAINSATIDASTPRLFAGVLDDRPQRNITIIAGPVTVGWDAAAPAVGWLAEAPTGNLWKGDAPVGGWAPGAVTG